jgi:uncharacterized protein YndB with AHSA1/START domain
MATRHHDRSVVLPLSPDRAFALLVTPSAIRGWWGAARAVVVPQTGGVWSAAWGDVEDDPDYVTAARIATFDPPNRLVLVDQCYTAKTGPLPFEAEFETEFRVEPCAEGSKVTVRQTGFPIDSVADDFYAACEQGWKDTLESMLRFSGSGSR